MTDREVMLKALDALEILNGAETVDGIFIYTTDEIFALRQALAQPEQSKYSDIVSDGGLDPRNKFDAQPEQESISTNDHLCAMLRQVHDVLACTALPMKRKWVGLTDEDINKAWEWAQKSSPYGVTRIETFAKSIEAKIKEKNEH